MRIEVTEESIEDGVRGSPSECPIAQALCAHGFGWPSVRRDHVVFTKHPGNFLGIKADLPEEAQTFVRSYDDGEEVEPFEFEIDLGGGS